MNEFDCETDWVRCAVFFSMDGTCHSMKKFFTNFHRHRATWKWRQWWKSCVNSFSMRKRLLFLFELNLNGIPNCWQSLIIQYFWMWKSWNTYKNIIDSNRLRNSIYWYFPRCDLLSIAHIVQSTECESIETTESERNIPKVFWKKKKWPQT